MIINLLRFRFRDDAGEAEKARALAAIARTAAVEAVAFSAIGQDLGDPAEGFTHAYCVGIPDLEALGRYFDAPVHREGDFLFLPLLAKLVRHSLSTDDDPAMAEKIAAVWRQKVANDEAWVGLFRLIPDLALHA
jgi:stress responsive alpha/beta barrel protein